LVFESTVISISTRKEGHIFLLLQVR